MGEPLVSWFHGEKVKRLKLPTVQDCCHCGGLAQGDPFDIDTAGLLVIECWEEDCGNRVSGFDPRSTVVRWNAKGTFPLVLAVLCSSCGAPMDREDAGFHCQPCHRGITRSGKEWALR